MVAVQSIKDQNAQRVIVVSGATGKQGGAAARHLLRRGFQVRALTRDPEKPEAKELSRLGAQVVRCDLNDMASLNEALRGADGVFSVQDLQAGHEGEIRQGIALADAAKAAGVKHLVYTSVGAANRNTGLPHFESKWQIEQHVRGIHVPYTIFRPVFFMENWGTYVRDAILAGTLPGPLSPDRALQQIAVNDIGVFVALALENPEHWIGREFDLAGDELTMVQVADALGRALGKPVRYVRVGWEEWRKNAGEEFTRMYEWFERVGYDVKIAEVRAEYPGLLRFGEFLQTQSWLRTGAAAPAGAGR